MLTRHSATSTFGDCWDRRQASEVPLLRRTASLALLLAALSLVAAGFGCRSNPTKDPPSSPSVAGSTPDGAGDIAGPGSRVEVQRSPWSLRFLGRDGRLLLATKGPVRFGKVTGQQYSFNSELRWQWTAGAGPAWSEAKYLTEVSG